ncbi:MAG: efflux RND transporter periplasmic adaptor subunit [Gemmatimonadota bacterium]|nr:efflux RND transporter periplasmic adaptor subunit [Gemmatimonadota bacterium]
MTSTPPDLSRLRIARDEPSAGQRGALRTAAILFGLAVVIIGAAYLYFRPGSALDVNVSRVEVSGGGGGSGTGITANGYVVARTRASVSSRLSGRLAMLAVEEGSKVRRGQVMARLENDEYVAALAQTEADSGRAEASLTEAIALRDQLERDLARSRDLVSRNMEAAANAEGLQAQLLAATARVGVQRAQIRSATAAIAYARANLDNTFIRAPFDGTILRKDAEVGEVVAPVAAGGGLTRGAVVTMADLETLEVEVDVNEAYIAQISDQQPTRIVLDAYPSAAFAGTVRQIVPTADRQRATVQVKVAISDRDARILPEMGARVEFLAVAQAADSAAPIRIFVTADAVRTEGAETVVYLVRNGVASRTVIEAGPVSGGRREVRAGLSGGEQVIINPPRDLAEGARVNVVN